jgi:hypothetical protein
MGATDLNAARNDLKVIKTRYLETKGLRKVLENDYIKCKKYRECRGKTEAELYNAVMSERKKELKEIAPLEKALHNAYQAAKNDYEALVKKESNITRECARNRGMGQDCTDVMRDKRRMTIAALQQERDEYARAYREMKYKDVKRNMSSSIQNFGQSLGRSADKFNNAIDKRVNKTLNAGRALRYDTAPRMQGYALQRVDQGVNLAKRVQSPVKVQFRRPLAPEK